MEELWIKIGAAILNTALIFKAWQATSSNFGWLAFWVIAGWVVVIFEIGPWEYPYRLRV